MLERSEKQIYSLLMLNSSEIKIGLLPAVNLSIKQALLNIGKKHPTWIFQDLKKSPSAKASDLWSKRVLVKDDGVPLGFGTDLIIKFQSKNQN